MGLVQIAPGVIIKGDILKKKTNQAIQIEKAIARSLNCSILYRKKDHGNTSGYYALQLY